MLTIQTRIKQIKANLLLEQPYFGSVAMLQKIKQNDDIATFTSSPEYFEYNDTFIEQLNDDELSFVLTNSAMHQALGYTHRKEGRIDWLWIMAQDYAINSLLVNNGLSLPDGLLYDDRFDMMSAEAIYHILENEIDEIKHTPKEIENIRYEKMPQSHEYDEDPISFEDQNQQLINKAKLQGDLPLGLEILIPKIESPTISWEDELYTLIENSIKFDYQLFPPNKRYLYQNIALPSLSGESVKIVIALDSSGSIDGNLLARFLNEVESIMNTFSSFEIDLLIADAKVHEHHILYPGDEISYTLKGGGGTDFTQTFTYIEEHISSPSLLLYFTDTFGTFPKEEPPYDVIWVTPSHEVQVPFGSIVSLQNDS